MVEKIHVGSPKNCPQVSAFKEPSLLKCLFCKCLTPPPPFQNSQRRSWGKEGRAAVQFGELTPISLSLHVHHAAASKA